MFGIVISARVGDVFIVERVRTDGPASRAFKEVCALLGFQLEHTKQKFTSITQTLLGAEVTIKEGWITARLPGRKRKEILDDWEQ